MITNTLSFEERRELLKAGLLNLSKPEHDALVNKGQSNGWLKRGGYDFEDDPYLEADSPYSFVRANDIETLELFFGQSNWAIRQGVVYEGLAFINQINGGDEWWTLKFDEECGKWIAFESITMHCFIEGGGFKDLVERLLNATVSECLGLNY